MFLKSAQGQTAWDMAITHNEQNIKRRGGGARGKRAGGSKAGGGGQGTAGSTTQGREDAAAGGGAGGRRGRRRNHLTLPQVLQACVLTRAEEEGRLDTLQEAMHKYVTEPSVLCAACDATMRGTGREREREREREIHIYSHVQCSEIFTPSIYEILQT